MKFYPTDWRSDPRLRMCGLAARGLWIEMIALMHEATPYGHLTVSGQSPTDAQLAVLAGTPSDQIPALLGELESAGVFSRTREGVIYSRKLTRMAKKAAIAKKNGKNGGNPRLGKQSEIPASDNQNTTDVDKPQKPEARSQKEIIPQAQRIEPASAAALPDDWLDQALRANGIGTGFRDERNPGLINPALFLGMLDAGFRWADITAGIASKPNPKARTWGYFEGQIRDFVGKRAAVSSVPAPQDRLAKLASWPLDRWRFVVEQFEQTSEWNREAYGPRPGEPGCLVPPLLLKAKAA